MRERFGKLVLLHETEVIPLGSEYRAAKLGPTGLEKIVSILRLKPEISMQPEPARRLMDQAKGAAQLQNPAILKILGIGKVEQSYYISYEFVLGKSLQQVLDRCREEQFPFAPDHALFIAAKTCSALEHAHGRRSDAGSRMFHGMLSPFCVSVSYDGDVKVKGFEFWQAHLREAGIFTEACLAYLAPEQSTAQGDTRSDIYSLGLVLLEMLTGQRPAKDAFARLSAARLASPQGDDDSLPKPILEILQKALAPDPANRYAEISEMRKALDTLLFSGDFSPTTFNVAFFMHSLFRDDSDREQQAVAQERDASYVEFLTEEGKTPPGGTEPTVMMPTVMMPQVPQPTPAPAPRAHVPAPSDSYPSAPRVTPSPVESHPPAPHSVRGSSESHPPVSASREEPSGLSAEDAAAGFTFHKEEPKGKGGLIAAAVIVLLLGGGGAAFYFLKMRAVPSPAVATPDPAVIEAQRKVRELEQKLAQIQAEKEAEEQKAADEAKSKLEEKARQRGQTADPAAIQKAQDDARKKAADAAADRQRRLEEDLKKAADDAAAKRAADDAVAARKAADDAAAKKAADDAAAKKVADDAAAKKAADDAAKKGASTPTSAPVQAGALVNVTDPGVVRPVVQTRVEPAYPPMARMQRIQGVVEVSALVDEKGAVVDVKVVKGVTGRWGLNEAAIAAAKKFKFRAATKDGVSVKVWFPVTFRFQL